MKFSELYQAAISMWPIEIDIEDGHPTGVSGYLFPKLVAVHDEIESSLSVKDNWMQVIDWALFQAFHSESKILIKGNKVVLNTRNVEIKEVQQRLQENLEAEGWEKELREYVNDI